MTKPKDALTTSDVEPVAMVDIVKADDPDYPERASVPADGVAHWLEQGWQLDK